MSIIGDENVVAAAVSHQVREPSAGGIEAPPPGYDLITPGIYGGINQPIPAKIAQERIPVIAVTPEERTRRQKAALELQSLIKDRDKAMTVYANRNARRGQRTFFFWNRPYDLGKSGRYTKAAISDSRRVLDESMERLNGFERQLALNAGVSPEDLDNYKEYFIMPDQKRLIDSVRDERMAAAELYRNGFYTGTFFKWWDNQRNIESYKKTKFLKGVTAAGYAGFVVAPALAAGALFGPVAGGAVAGLTVSRTYHRYDQRKNSFKRVEDQDQELRDLPPADMPQAYELIESQTGKNVRRNQARVASHAGATALGGALGGLVGALKH
jgi:hypothetical protein